MPLITAGRQISGREEKSQFGPRIPDHYFSNPELSYAQSMTTKRAVRKRSRRIKTGLCKVHGRPIRPSYWRAGHRTTGCAECYRTKEVPPPRKRLCKRHGQPILRSRWWSGYRTKGCVLCFKVPPPGKRLCRRHGRPIQPSAWRNGRHSTGCSRCHNSRPGYLEAKARYNQRLRKSASRTRKKKKR